MNRVKDERDSGRFEARGEQMMRMDYLTEKRRWEESMVRDLDGVVQEGDVEEEMIPGKRFCDKEKFMRGCLLTGLSR